MDKIFASRPGRLRFLFTIGILLFLLLLIRFLIFPLASLKTEANEIFISFLDKSSTSIFTAVIVGYFIYWVQGDDNKKAIDFTKSKEDIETALSLARSTTSVWLFNGGLGRYTRAISLPKLSELATKENKTITIKIINLNPYNEELLNEYCQFRLTFEPNEKNKWNIIEVQAEIFATIIAAVIARTNNRLLDVYVGIKNHFTLSRMDISAEFGVITRENPKIPSLILKNGSFLYTHYIEEFYHAYRQCQILSHVFLPFYEDLNTELVQEIVKKLFPDKEILANMTLLNKIIEKVSHPKSPF